MYFVFPLKLHLHLLLFAILYLVFMKNYTKGFLKLKKFLRFYLFLIYFHAFSIQNILLFYLSLTLNFCTYSKFELKCIKYNLFV